MAIGNSTEKFKMNYEDIWDLILVEEIHRKNSNKSSSFNSTLIKF
jgi:hypothetical protein